MTITIERSVDASQTLCRKFEICDRTAHASMFVLNVRTPCSTAQPSKRPVAVCVPSLPRHSLCVFFPSCLFQSYFHPVPFLSPFLVLHPSHPSYTCYVLKHPSHAIGTFLFSLRIFTPSSPSYLFYRTLSFVHPTVIRLLRPFSHSFT